MNWINKFFATYTCRQTSLEEFMALDSQAKERFIDTFKSSLVYNQKKEFIATEALAYISFLLENKVEGYCNLSSCDKDEYWHQFKNYIGSLSKKQSELFESGKF